MNKTTKFLRLALPVLCGAILLSSFLGETRYRRFPYREAGLTERQAAAHLISRFTYGATPGQVDEVVKMGLEKWFRQQLDAALPDDSLQAMLAQYDALKLNNVQIAETFPKNGQVVRMAIRDGYIDKDSVRADKKAYRDILKKYMDDKGYKPEQELFRQLYCQKVLRAAYSQNQLREVMTDFWFNHFNVSITKNDCAEFIPVYERDVIRPGALGRFGDLLKATAHSPAMLYYLDNFTSSGPVDSTKPMQKARKAQGLNENYARELMELHTLGVDGGYTQQDVTQAARVLTGWTVYPMGLYGKAMEQRLNRVGDDKLERQGFVHEGDFLFAANRHDKGEKVVLGKHFGPNGGYEEGIQLLDMLAHHPSTARFISRKIAIRFVSDDPPAGLVDRMAKTFRDKDGDIREVLMTMVTSPEFWSTSAVREKTKSPFELAMGAVRSLHARINQPFQLYSWVTRMGEKMYFYQAPTGFPDKGQFWINTGSLLNRMNFGLALATGRIPGITFDLAVLNNNHEPESAQAALVTYCRLIMPERDLDQTIQRLTPMLGDPGLQQKVNAAAATHNDEMAMTEPAPAPAPSPMTSATTAQVVGIIIGSPEFQRR
ncbi:MAG TPA: DUF1800 domain-containing protein [Puia sp.]|nr:DUF1800 domain-containing protein [Puia sp.]